MVEGYSRNLASRQDNLLVWVYLRSLTDMRTFDSPRDKSVIDPPIALQQYQRIAHEYSRSLAAAVGLPRLPVCGKLTIMIRCSPVPVSGTKYWTRSVSTTII